MTHDPTAADGGTPVAPSAAATRQGALARGLGCYYADRTRRPVRPYCQGVAVVAYGPIALCAACDKARSAVGRGVVGRRVPGVELQRLIGVARALASAEREVADAIRLARQAGASWSQVGDAIGVSRQPAQQRWRRATAG